MTEPTPDDPTTPMPPTTPPDVSAPPPVPAASVTEPSPGRNTRTILEIVGAGVAVVLIAAAAVTGFALGALVTGHDDRDGSRQDRDVAMAPQAPGERGYDGHGDRGSDRGPDGSGPDGFGPQMPGQPVPPPQPQG